LLIVGGEADVKPLARLRAALPKAAAHFAENLPLPYLAAVLEKCSFFLGHDSGISHIAAAVGARCVLLFGPSDPAVWAPVNSDVRVVRANNGMIGDLSAEDVTRAIDAAGFLAI
jgi:heptosyltransferase-2